jgi:hypothetical protein
LGLEIISKEESGIKKFFRQARPSENNSGRNIKEII